MLDNTKSSTWTDAEWDTFTDWLKGMLRTEKVNVTFTKADGTERVMYCTLNPDLLPKVEPKAELKEGAKTRKENTTALKVYDLEKSEWRSFTIKKVKGVSFVLGEENIQG
jgi:hypothetical protein